MRTTFPRSPGAAFPRSRRGDRVALLLLASWLTLFQCVFPACAAGQEDPPPGDRELAGTATDETGTALRRSEDVLTAIMGMLDAAGLDCLRCTWKATVAREGNDVLQLEARGDNPSRIRQFFQDLGRRWAWDLESFTAKPGLSDTSEPQVLFSCELVLSPGRVDPKQSGGEGGREPAALGPLFQIFGQMPFFSMSGKPPAGPALFGCTNERGKVPGFQVIAPVLDQLLQAQAAGPLPGRSRSLSRTGFLGVDLYTIDFTDQPDGLPVSDMVGLFKTLAGAADLREIIVPRGPERASLVQATLDLTPAQWAAVEGICSAGFGYDLLKAEGKGEVLQSADATSWTAVLLLRKGSGRGFPCPEIGSLLAAGWPPALKPGLRFTWLPTSLRLSAQVGGEPDAAALRQVAEPLGLAYLGPQSTESLAANAMIVAFSHGPPPPPQGTPGAAAPAGPPRIGEVIDHAVTPDGPRISVKVPFSDLPALLEQLRREDTCVSQCSLVCHPPDHPVLSYVQVEGNRDRALRIFRLAEELARAPLPWNRPLEMVSQGLLLEGFTLTGGEEFELSGSTMKSRQIFSDLFPLLERVPGVNTPFFREGKYRDHQGGRLLRFVVTARWNEPRK